MDFNYKYYQENSDQSKELLEYTMYGGKYDIELVDNIKTKTVESFKISKSNDSAASRRAWKSPSLRSFDIEYPGCGAAGLTEGCGSLRKTQYNH